MQSHRCLVLYIQTCPLRLNEAENWYFRIKDVTPSVTDLGYSPNKMFFSQTYFHAPFCMPCANVLIALESLSIPGIPICLGMMRELPL